MLSIFIIWENKKKNKNKQNIDPPTNETWECEILTYDLDVPRQKSQVSLDCLMDLCNNLKIRIIN